jgi:hypothetical protein
MTRDDSLQNVRSRKFYTHLLISSFVQNNLNIEIFNLILTYH